MPMPHYIRRYSVRILGFGLAYVAALTGALMVMNQPWAPRGVLAYLLAALPALAIVGMLWAIGKLILEIDDEYQRLLAVKQTLIGTGLTLAIATIWGFLENFDLVPHLAAFYVTVLWFAMFGVSGAIARWRA